jgi:hypothetical protein
MDNQLPKVKIAKVLDLMDATDHEGNGTPFQIKFVASDGRIIEYAAARLARNVKKELPLQLRRSLVREQTNTDRRAFNTRMAPESSIKRLYISELSPPFRNCWFRSIIEFNGREVSL